MFKAAPRLGAAILAIGLVAGLSAGAVLAQSDAPVVEPLAKPRSSTVHITAPAHTEMPSLGSSIAPAAPPPAAAPAPPAPSRPAPSPAPASSAAPLRQRARHASKRLAARRPAARSVPASRPRRVAPAAPRAARPAAIVHAPRVAALKPAPKRAARPAPPATYHAQSPAPKTAESRAAAPIKRAVVQPAPLPPAAQAAAAPNPAPAASEPLPIPAKRLPTLTFAAPPKAAPQAPAAAPPRAPAQAPSAVAPSAPESSVESMTRDGGQASAAGSTDAVSATGQATRALGALAVALVLVVIAINVLRRYRTVIESWQAGRPPAAPKVNEAASADFASFLKRTNAAGAQSIDHRDALASGDLEVVSARTLAGTGSAVYLIRASNRMMLLGASSQGGVRTLAEWDVEETRTVAEQHAAFDDYLRSQTSIEPELQPENDIERVRTRLRDATGRFVARARADAQQVNGSSRAKP